MIGLYRTLQYRTGLFFVEKKRYCKLFSLLNCTQVYVRAYKYTNITTKLAAFFIAEFPYINIVRYSDIWNFLK